MAAFSFRSGTRITPAANEQRRAPRAEHSLLVRVRQGALAQEGICADFSLSGLRLRLVQAIDEAQPLEVSIFVPNEDLDSYTRQTPATISCRVVRASREGGKFVYGVEFGNASEADRHTIRRCFQFFNKNAEF